MKTMNDELLEPTYKTKDLGLGVFLYTTGHELTGTTLEDPRKVVLHFRRQKETEQLILDYFNGTAQAPVKKLLENLRTLKGLIYARTNNVR
jgi:hypothetical protein